MNTREFNNQAIFHKGHWSFIKKNEKKKKKVMLMPTLEENYVKVHP